MQGLEIETTSNEGGRIVIQLAEAYKNKKVRVIILMDDDLNDKKWLAGISKNPAFDFLNNPEEEIYTLEDGEPYQS